MFLRNIEFHLKEFRFMNKTRLYRQRIHERIVYDNVHFLFKVSERIILRKNLTNWSKLTREQIQLSRSESSSNSSISLIWLFLWQPYSSWLFIFTSLEMSKTYIFVFFEYYWDKLQSTPLPFNSKILWTDSLLNCPFV